MSKKKILIILAVIGVISLTLRLINFMEMKSNNPIFDYPIVDSHEYVGNADYLANTNWLGKNEPYYHPPLYPYFIAATFSVFGEHISHVKAIQIILDTITIFLIYSIASIIFGPKTALVSSGLYGLYIPAIQYTSEILPPILLIFLFMLGLLCMVNFTRSFDTPRRRFLWLAAAGIAWGLLVITLPNLLICALLAAAWIIAYGPGTLRLKAGCAGIFTAIVLVFVLLVTVRNYLMSGQAVIISTNSSINLYIGNNENINRTVSIRPGIQWERFCMYPYETERITNSQEENIFWYKQAFAYMKEHPFGWILLMLKKTVLFFNTHEFPHNFDSAFYGEFSIISSMPVITLRLIMPLGLCGMLFALFRLRKRKNADYIRLLMMVFLGYAASIILFFIAGRYRLPVVPILILFASNVVLDFVEDVRHKNHKPNIIRLALVLVLVLLTAPKFFHNSYPYAINKNETYTMLGLTLQNNGRMNEAMQYFRLGLKEPIDPYTDEMYVHIAYFYIQNRNIEIAMDFFQKAYELNPKNHYVLNNLGYNHQMQGDYEKAITYYSAATRAAPFHPVAYLYLVQCNLLLKKEDKALNALESFYDICPSPHPTISYNMGLFFMDIRKDYKKAAEYFRESLRYPQGLEPEKDIHARLEECNNKI